MLETITVLVALYHIHIPVHLFFFLFQMRTHPLPVTSNHVSDKCGISA